MECIIPKPVLGMLDRVFFRYVDFGIEMLLS
jgi:hypothetical protein